MENWSLMNALIIIYSTYKDKIFSSCNCKINYNSLIYINIANFSFLWNLKIKKAIKIQYNNDL